MEAFSAGGEIWGRRSKELEALAFVQIWTCRTGAQTHTQAKKKKGQLNVAMESAFLTPAPSHATVDIRAAAVACGQATAASAVA